MITLKSDDSLAVRIARLEELARRYRAMGLWSEVLVVEREAMALERRLRDAMKPQRKEAKGRAAHGGRTMYQKDGCRCDDCRAANTRYHREYRARRRVG